MFDGYLPQKNHSRHQHQHSHAAASPAPPPPFSARPILFLSLCLFPASPLSWTASSCTIERPVAPTGWPFDTKPPYRLTGNRPPSFVWPSSINFPPDPTSQKPSISS